VFRRVEQSVAGPAGRDLPSLANEARKLERRRLLQHGRSSAGFVTLSLTPRGRRFIGLRYGEYTRPVAASLIAPVAVACGSLPGSPQNSAPSANSAQLPSKPSSVVTFDPAGSARQEVINGRKVWVWCSSNDCVRTTPKEELKQLTPPVTDVARVAPPKLDAPVVPSTASASHFSVFFGFASGAPEAGTEAALLRAAHGVDRAARITVTGTTDRTGDPALNEKLARNRANAVRLLLVKAGFAERNIAIEIDVSGSRRMPTQFSASPTTPKGDAQFRRADIEFGIRGTSLARVTLDKRPAGTQPLTATPREFETCVTQTASFGPPVGLRPKMHVARFEVTADPAGRPVSRATMVQSSGVSAFDAELGRAVERCMVHAISRSAGTPLVLTADFDLFTQALKHDLSRTTAPAPNGRPAAATK